MCQTTRDTARADEANGATSRAAKASQLKQTRCCFRFRSLRHAFAHCMVRGAAGRSDRHDIWKPQARGRPKAIPRPQGQVRGLRAALWRAPRSPRMPRSSPWGRENSTMFAGSSDPHRSPVTALLGISIFSLRRRVCPQASCRKWLLLCSAC